MTDFFQAEFVGTGNLTAYTPEIGAALTVPKTTNILIGPPYDPAGIPAAALTYFHRNTTGYWVNEFEVGYDNPPMYTSATPSGPDYYVETVIKLGSASHSESLYHAHCLRGIRGTAGEAGYFDCLGGVWYVEYASGTWRVYFSTDSAQDRAAAVTYVTFDTPSIDTQPTNVGATDVTLRTEIEGFTMRAFVDTTLVYEGTYSGTTYFNSAGKVMWDYYFNGVADNAESTIAVSAMRAGDTFLPPPAGDFWQDFVKTVEA